MNKSDLLRILKSLFLVKIPTALLLYVLAPLLVLIFLAKPVADAVRASGTAVCYILVAAAGAVVLNWLIYSLIRKRRPSLLVFSFGMLCLLLVSVVMYDALPGFSPLASTLSYICALFALLFLFLLSYWLAIRNTKPSRAAAVVLRIVLALLFWGVVYQIYREIESRNVTADTWITIGFLIALLIGFNIPRLLPVCRRARFRRRTTGLAEGRIVQVVGETHLDRDDDSVTVYHVRVEYSVDNVPYETRADISRYTIRKFGREAFIGREVPVHYDPADPAQAYTDRIDRHFFDNDPKEEDDPQSEN